MIPVIGMLHYRIPDVTQKAIDSIPEGRAEKFVIVDNSPEADSPHRHDIHMIRLRANMGVAHGWNTIIKATPEAEWWFILNNDVEMGEAGFQAMEQAIAAHDLVLMGGYHAFGIRRSALRRIGWFDESFHPAYCEDNDYTWRAQQAGLKITQVGSPKHLGSVTIQRDRASRERNDQTFPQNVSYYHAKWGGHMHAEVFKTPFNSGGSLAIKEPDIDRLASQRWG